MKKGKKYTCCKKSVLSILTLVNVFVDLVVFRHIAGTS